MQHSVNPILSAQQTHYLHGMNNTVGGRRDSKHTLAFILLDNCIHIEHSSSYLWQLNTWTAPRLVTISFRKVKSQMKVFKYQRFSWDTVNIKKNFLSIFAARHQKICTGEWSSKLNIKSKDIQFIYTKKWWRKRDDSLDHKIDCLKFQNEHRMLYLNVFEIPLLLSSQLISHYWTKTN